MTDKLTPTQTLLVWCLLAKQGIAKQADIMPAPKAADRKVLEKARFVTVTKRSRALWLTLADAGWAWAATHLREPLPPAQGGLHDMMCLLSDHLAKTGEELSSFIGAAPEPEPPKAPVKKARKGPATTATQEPKRAVRETRTSQAGAKRVAPIADKGLVPEATVRDRIEGAYLAITNGRKGVDAKLSEVRLHLSGLDRAAVDAALNAMQRDGKARLMRQDDRRSISAADAEAAVRQAGESFHILWILE